MGQILLEGMEFFAYHGHYSEEKFAGNKFTIDLHLWTDTSIAQKSDNIFDALNYQHAYILVKNCMSNNKVNLLENICDIILEKLFAEFDNLDKAKIILKKLNPPMGGQIASVGLAIEKKREE